MFEFMDNLSPVSKGLIAATAAAGVATLVSRHFDKKEVAAAIAAADEQAAAGDPTQVYDPTVPMGTPQGNPQI